MGGIPEGLSEAILEAARAAGIGITVTQVKDKASRVLWVSPRAAEILGHPEETLIGNSPLANVVPEEHERLFDTAMRRARGDVVPASYETVVLDASGKRVPIAIAVSYLTLGEANLAICFLQDNTERKRVESAVRASEARLRTVVEGAPDGVAISRRGVLLWVNRAAAQLLGAESPEALVGRSLGEFLEPEGMTRMGERIGRLLAGGRPESPMEYRARRADGSTVVAEIAALAIDWEGAPAIIAFARDVTERASLQSQLARSERLAAVGTLAAGVAHEINNPLTFVTLGVDALERALADGAPRARIDVTLQEIRHGAARVAAIVRELSVFARVDDDLRSSIDIASVLAAAERLVAHALRGRARIERRITENERVLANGGRLEQVFVNLLLNAVQALPEGDAENVIEISTAASPGGNVVIEVRDNGHGIAPEILPRVFDPFFTTKAPGVGTGLGLAVCHRIVTQLGGDIAVSSTLGRGTVVRVSLPRPTDEPVREVRPATTPSARRKILIVDDERSMVSTLCLLLERDHEVVGTTDVHEAMRRLIEDPIYDVILCDISMPKLDGPDLFERVTTKKPELRERFVFVTGGAFTEKTRAFLDTTRPRCIQKPFRLAEIHDLLRTFRA